MIETNSNEQKLITRITYPLSCQCGHMGAITKEISHINEKSYWENYTCHYLRCQKEFFSRRKIVLMDVLNKLKPICPKCKTKVLQET